MEKDNYKITWVSPAIGTQHLAGILSELASNGLRHAFIGLKGYEIDLPEESARRMLQIADDTDAGIIYCDYRATVTADREDGTKEISVKKHPLAPYQPGSVRDDFDFGPLMLIDTSIADGENSTYRFPPEASHYSGLYACRLAIASKGAGQIIHLPEYLYTASEADLRASGEKQFDYVDPRFAEVQKEREEVFTAYLRNIGACLPPSRRLIDTLEGDFPVEASVIIPVRDRVSTIGDAVKSALSQQTDFDFNVIVIDNHSSDGTTRLLHELSAADNRVVHLIPDTDDLGIGGCWEYGVADRRCGRYAVQLDSDDKYKDATTLQQVIDCFRKERCAMVIGSYELTDFDGNPIPPGLIDHKEWTPSNGHNNALRINGLGAPRAFFTPVLRKIGVPNVSYGEDYALGLRISRRYKIGRIYKSLYLCRRWKGNSDADLSQERVNANNIYKDLLRTIEIEARKMIIGKENRRYGEEAARKTASLSRFRHTQLEQWPMAKSNTEALSQVKRRVITVDGVDFTILFNPARAVSSGAKVDSRSIAERPCFLCRENRPECQKELNVMEGYSLLVNPFPVFKGHYTIASDTHQPQLVCRTEPDGESRYATMFRLCQQLPGSTIFYNGARCGASAPDHLHFQAVDSEDFPLFDSGSHHALPYLNYFFTAGTIEDLDFKMKEALERISRLPGNEGEAETRINMFMQAAATREGFHSLSRPAVEVLVIPRKAHRPSCYGTGEGQMLISPGAIDSAGWIITSRKEDFDNLDAEKLERILRETTYWMD